MTTCDSTVFNNCTYIENPLYPTKQAASSTCAYKIRPISSDICQLRLDLDNFDLTGNLQILYNALDTNYDNIHIVYSRNHGGSMYRQIHYDQW